MTSYFYPLNDNIRFTHSSTSIQPYTSLCDITAEFELAF